MSTFRNNLIERLRTRLVDVDLKTNWEKVSIALAKKFEFRRTRKYGANGRADCPVRVLCQGAAMAVTNHSLGRWGSIKSVWRIVENEDGVAGVRLEPILTTMPKYFSASGFVTTSRY